MNNNRILSLYYHRVNTMQTDYNQLCVSPVKFRQQMLYLKQNYQIAGFADNWDVLDTDAVVITFDDGYLDNLEYAVPILEDLEIPATIFISTGTMDQSKELWWDELERLVLIDDNIPAYFKLIDDEFDIGWNTDTWEDRRNCYESIHYLMKNYISPQKREEWLLQLWNWRGIRRLARRSNLTVSVDDCKNLAQSKIISVGAHTVNHPSLGCMDKESQKKEIGCSIEILEKIFERKITLFSYPFGQPEKDFNEDTINICREYGILRAASTENALWTSATNSYKIPRKVVRDWDLGEFKSKMEEYWERK